MGTDGATPGSMVAEFWDEEASRYDRYFGGDDGDGHALRARLDATVRLVGSGTGRFLDAGMGPGRLCEVLDRRGWLVAGVDASAAMVELARRRVPAAADRLVQAAIEQLPFEAESFDAVAATGVLEYADVRAALGELSRVLCRDGVAVVSYPNPRALYGIWKSRVWYRLVRGLKRVWRRSSRGLPRGGPEIPPERFAGLLAEAGLRVEAIAHTGYLVVPTPLDVILPRLTVWLGRRLEGTGPRWGARLATQIVYAARKQ